MHVFEMRIKRRVVGKDLVQDYLSRFAAIDAEIESPASRLSDERR